jgi:hypothetical protein
VSFIFKKKTNNYLIVLSIQTMFIVFLADMPKNNPAGKNTKRRPHG